LVAAHDEFVLHGLSGARVDAIAARTNTVKRMIYYYFGSKEGLYLAVLERAYAAIRKAEEGLELEQLAPRDAVQRMMEFTFDYHDANPDFVRLVSIENINQGRFIAQSKTIRDINITVVDMLRRILDRGSREGIFRPGLDAVDVHMLISSISIFRVANRHTFGTLFHNDMNDPAQRAKHRAFMVDVVLRTLEQTT
jgi:AcrR family transcriptional regulator